MRNPALALMACVLALGACSRHDDAGSSAAEEPREAQLTDDPSPGVTVDETHAEAAEHPTGPASERIRKRRPSRFHDEEWLAAAGFLTSRSGLAPELLEAAFVDAACTSGGDLIARFLAAGYSPDSENAAGVTPLHCAALRGDDDQVRKLIELGAAVDATTWEERLTPLHYAALGRHTRVARALVEAGADVNADSGLGSPMLLALRDVDAERQQRQFDLETALPQAYEEWMRWGADVEGADKDGNRPLHHAARRSNVPWVRDLIARGASLDAKNEAGETPLVVAMNHLAIDASTEPASTRQLPLLRALIEAGADVNDRDSRGVPLVVRIGHSPDLMPLFLEAGADFNAVGHECETFWGRLMDYAWGYMPEKVYVDVFAKADAVREIAEKPVANGKPCNNPLHIAARTGDPRLVKYFLQRGLDPDARGKYGFTPLHLLAANPPLDRRSQDPALRALQLLLDADADVNARDDAGRTALQVAERRPEEFRAMLVRVGAR